MKKEIDDIDNSIGSVIGGAFFESICMIFKEFAVGLPTFGFGASISVIKDYIDMVIGMVKTFKDNCNELDMKVFNTRRAKIKGIIKQYHSILNSRYFSGVRDLFV